MAASRNPAHLVPLFLQIAAVHALRQGIPLCWYPCSIKIAVITAASRNPALGTLVPSNRGCSCAASRNPALSVPLFHKNRSYHGCVEESRSRYPRSFKLRLFIALRQGIPLSVPLLFQNHTYHCCIGESPSVGTLIPSNRGCLHCVKESHFVGTLAPQNRSYHGCVEESRCRYPRIAAVHALRQGIPLRRYPSSFKFVSAHAHSVLPFSERNYLKIDAITLPGCCARHTGFKLTFSGNFISFWSPIPCRLGVGSLFRSHPTPQAPSKAQ
ncbi:hypothetical protein C8F01DRAFT_1087209 [Mycena amicta]|nr:hypothetical protein C8F01DRAFT_1087209 [Mycena amicta]